MNKEEYLQMIEDLLIDIGDLKDDVEKAKRMKVYAKRARKRSISLEKKLKDFRKRGYIFLKDVNWKDLRTTK